ncbi:ferredoxin domain-containing protein [Methanolapillus millepedarum]|uniref:4Fe-4S domain-containing protein n=1 Tax=Methanolapillus millepedarum TaxID=3028296 RepID=A0AA96V3I4_9EURY|nr:hypothetical protein MsAc7_07560 [Methanosarcinaceae archaeon Ac7]
MMVDAEKDALLQMAKEILVAARTAPKGKGIDNLVTYILNDSEKEMLANEMEKLSEKLGMFFVRDAGNIRNSDLVTIIGLKDTKPPGLNCGACGFGTCAGLTSAPKNKESVPPFSGPICAIKSVDLGIAIGSAVSKAKDMCLDNRIMYSAGAAACSVKMIDAEYAFAVPLSVSGKSIYFDRKQ